MQAAYYAPTFPGFRPVDGDGDILMADAHPVERPRPDQMFIETPTGPRRQRGPWQRRFPNNSGTNQYRGQPTGLGRPSAAPSTSFEQRNLPSSPFGNQLRHLPPPLPSSPTRLSSQVYLSEAMLNTPDPPGSLTLPPLSSLTAKTHGREGYDHASRQIPVFSKPAPSPEIIDLTRDSSSPLTSHTRGGLPLPDNFWYEPNRPSQPWRGEGPGQVARSGFPNVERALPTHPAADGRFGHPAPRHGAPPQTPPHFHRRRLTRPATPKVSCTACLEEFKRDDLLQLACNCRYCTPCLNLSFEAGCANMASFPPKCCGRPIRISIWGSVLEPRVLERYKKVESEFSANRPLYCASLKCSTFIPEEDFLPQQEVGVCPKCTSSTCVQCRRLMDDHIKWEIYERVCPKQEADLVKLYELGSAKKWKQCPTCLIMVEKTDGCNHMDCVCGVEFCYRCGHLFDEDDSCECEPQWDEEDEDDEDEDEDEDEENEDEDSEWPDYRIAVDPAGRIKCLHLHTTPLGTDYLHCHGCLQRNLVLTCDDCALELCQACVDKVQKGVAGESDSSDDESMGIDGPDEKRLGGLSRAQDVQA